MARCSTYAAAAALLLAAAVAAARPLDAQAAAAAPAAAHGPLAAAAPAPAAPPLPGSLADRLAQALTPAPPKPSSGKGSTSSGSSKSGGSSSSLTSAAVYKVKWGPQYAPYPLLAADCGDMVRDSKDRRPLWHPACAPWPTCRRSMIYKSFLLVILPRHDLHPPASQRQKGARQGPRRHAPCPSLQPAPIPPLRSCSPGKG